MQTLGANRVHYGELENREYSRIGNVIKIFSFHSKVFSGWISLNIFLFFCFEIQRACFSPLFFFVCILVCSELLRERPTFNIHYFACLYIYNFLLFY